MFPHCHWNPLELGITSMEQYGYIANVVMPPDAYNQDTLAHTNDGQHATGGSEAWAPKPKRRYFIILDGRLTFCTLQQGGKISNSISLPVAVAVAVAMWNAIISCCNDAIGLRTMNCI